MSRLVHVIELVRVVVSDVNGPRGGVDKECLVRIDHRRGGPLIIRRTATNTREAVDRALARARDALARAIARTTQDRRTALRR